MKATAAILFGFVFGVQGVCIAAGDKGYSRADCVALSLEESAVARNAAIDEAIAGARVKQARSIALPHLSATAVYTRLDELQEVELGEEVLEVGTLDNYSVEGRIEQLLFAGGKMKAAITAAGITRRYARYLREEVEAAVTRDTIRLYNDILLAQSTVSVLEDSVKVLKELVSQTTEIRDAGRAADFDVLRAEVKYENELPQLIRARNSLAILIENLKKLTGIEDEEVSLSDGLEYEAVELDSDELLADALAGRPLMLAQAAVSRLRREDVTSARSDMIPSLSGYLTYNGANSYGFVTFGDDEWEWHWNAGLAVSWNIWDGDLSRGLLKEKKLEFAKSEVDVDDTERAVVLEVKSAILNIRNAAESVSAAARNVKLAEKSMEIASTRHEEGLSTYLDYTDANVSLKQARLSYLVSVAAHMNAIAELRYAVGTDSFRGAENEE